MPFAEVVLSDLYDKEHAVNGVGTDVNGVIIRDRWNQVATVRVVDHPADSLDTPALFTNSARFKTWRLGKAKLGTATILADMSGIDIVIPGAEQSINPEIPPPVSDFITGVTTPTSIDLHWSTAVGWAFQGYHLEQQIVGVDPDYRRIASLAPSAVAFIASDLPPDSLVRFRIRTYQTLVGVWSNTDGITDIEAEETLPPITGGEILNVDPATQDLEWSYDEGDNPENFRIEYAVTGDDVTYQPLAVVDGSTSSYQVESLPSDRLIFYRIRAETDDEISIWQSESETTLPDEALELPVWDPIPPLTVEVSALPFEYDVSSFVTSSTELINWRYSPSVEYISIDEEDGLLHLAAELPQSVNVIRISVDNTDGTGTSEQFQIEIDDVEEPDKDIQVVDNFNRSNRLLSSDGSWGESFGFLRIHNEAVIQHVADTNGFAFYEQLASRGQTYVQIQIVAPPTQPDQWVGVQTRFNSQDWPTSANFYTFTVSSNRVQIRRYWAVTEFVILAETAVTIQRDDIFLGSSIDNIHEIFINGALVLAVEDTAWNPILSFNGFLSDNPDQDAIMDNYESGIPLRIPSVPPLTPVENFQIAGKSTNWIRLEWKHTGSLSHFRLERFVLGTDTEWQVLEATLDPQAQTYDDTGLASETVHIYRIRTENSAGEVSMWTEVEDETESDDGLNDVYDFETTNHSYTTLDLEWKYDGTGNTGFTLHILENGTYVSLGGEDDPSVRIRNVTDLNPDTEYEFRMRAYDADSGSAWQYTSGRTDIETDESPPRWITIPNFVVDSSSLPWSGDMNDYVTSATEITHWSIPNFSGVTIDSDGILTVTIEGDWSLKVTSANLYGSSQSNDFTFTAGAIGDVHYAPARFPLRINNPRPANDLPNNQIGFRMQSWSRYHNTHSQVPYEVPIGIGGGRPPFRFSISGSSNFTLTTKSPDFNPGMTTWAEVTAEGGAEGTYTVTVTDMDNESQSVSVTVVNDDSMFVFIASDGDDGASGTIDDPIETCQGWYGATAYTVSRFVGMIVVYRTGSYVMPTSIGYSYHSGAIYYGDEYNPVVHIAMPGEEVSVTGRLGYGSGFFTNDGSSASTRDNYWAGIKIDGNALLGSAFSFWSGAHRHVFWKMQFEDIQSVRFTAYRDNFGGMIYLSKGNWRSSSISAIDIEFIDWSRGTINHGGYQSYGNIHANLDWIKVINCTRTSPGEAVFFKSDNNYCTLTSMDSWWTEEYVNNINRSMMNVHNSHDSSVTVSEDYGVPWHEASSQLRYCRVYQDPSNHGQQNIRLVNSGTNTVMNKVWMDRCTHIGWAESSSGVGGVGTNPVTKAPIRPELVRCIHLANRPWGNSNLPLGYIVTDSVNENYDKLDDYIDHETGIVKDAAIRFQIGFEVPATIASSFFGDIDHDAQNSPED